MLFSLFYDAFIDSLNDFLFIVSSIDQKYNYLNIIILNLNFQCLICFTGSGAVVPPVVYNPTAVLKES